MLGVSKSINVYDFNCIFNFGDSNVVHSINLWIDAIRSRNCRLRFEICLLCFTITLFLCNVQLLCLVLWRLKKALDGDYWNHRWWFESHFIYLDFQLSTRMGFLWNLSCYSSSFYGKIFYKSLLQLFQWLFWDFWWC